MFVKTLNYGSDSMQMQRAGHHLLQWNDSYNLIRAACPKKESNVLVCKVQNHTLWRCSCLNVLPTTHCLSQINISEYVWEKVLIENDDLNSKQTFAAAKYIHSGTSSWEPKWRKEHHARVAVAGLAMAHPEGVLWYWK